MGSGQVLVSHLSTRESLPQAPEYYRTTPPTNWFLRVTNGSMDWRQPLADPSIATSLFCSCNLSPDFCGPTEILYCPECTVPTFQCSNVFSHQDLYCPTPPPPTQPSTPTLTLTHT